MRMTGDIEAWHAGKTHLDRKDVAPFLHAGTFEQARMRSKGPLTRLTLRPRRIRRVVDRGENRWSEKRLSDALSRGFDMIVYLNRFEGIPMWEFEAAREILTMRGRSDCLDRISDGRFHRLVPSARDSVIILDPAIVRSCMHLAEPGSNELSMEETR